MVSHGDFARLGPGMRSAGRGEHERAELGRHRTGAALHPGTVGCGIAYAGPTREALLGNFRWKLGKIRSAEEYFERHSGPESWHLRTKAAD